MDLDFPRFVEELAEEGAAAAGVDVLTYLCVLVCEDANRREEVRKNPPRLPDIPPGAQERALKKLLRQRASRLSREKVIPFPLTGRGRSDARTNK
ncbi:MAG: hypothetical protein ACYCS7_03905 [Acidimicrobiales bacterium]